MKNEKGVHGSAKNGVTKGGEKKNSKLKKLFLGAIKEIGREPHQKDRGTRRGKRVALVPQKTSGKHNRH